MNRVQDQLESSISEDLFQLRAELCFHVVLLMVAAAVIAMSFAMRTVGDQFVFLPGAVLPMPDSCMMKNVFGFECPGCGLTRAFISISDLEFSRAWKFNPASFLIYVFVVGQIPWRLFQIGRIFKGRLPVFSIWLFLPLGIVVVGLISQWLWRLSF